MKKKLLIITTTCLISVGHSLVNEPAEASWDSFWHHVGHAFSSAFHAVANTFDTVVTDVSHVADDAIQVGSMLVQEGIHGVATVAEKGVADVAKGLGDITGQHAIFDKLGAHVDAAIAGAATEATIATSTVATLAETSVNASALIATHPTLAPKIAALAVETDILRCSPKIRQGAKVEICSKKEKEKGTDYGKNEQKAAWSTI